MLDLPGLSCEAQTLYRQLLSVSALPLTDANPIAASVLAELTNAGLAVRLPDEVPGHPSALDEPRLVATTPDESLARLLLTAEKRLNARQERLLDVRNELGRIRTAFEAARDTRRPAGLVEFVVGAESVAAAHRSVHAAARTELSIFDTGYFDVPTEVTTVILPEAAKVTAGVRFRTVYDHSVFENDPVEGAITLTESAAGGEIQRLVPELPLKMVLADESLALVALTLTGIDGALLVRSEPLLALLRMYFELVWDRGVPVGGDAIAAENADRYSAIARLLATGLTDDAVALQLGLSLRTVRRSIAQMMEDLGAVTRFQAGVLAERAGLLQGRGELIPAQARPSGSVIDLREVQCSETSV